MAPIFDQPSEERGSDVSESGDSDWSDVEIVVHTPYRLLRAAPNGLSVDQLVLPETPKSANPERITRSMLPLLSKQLFPHLNPRTVVHTDPTKVPGGGSPLQWKWVTLPIDPAFLSHWRNLERVTVKGMTTICLSAFGDDELETPLYSFWSPPPLPELDGHSNVLDRGLELVFDFTAWVPSFTKAFVEGYPDHGLAWYLDRGGVSEGLERRVRLRVPQADESVVREEVAKLAEWMKQLVVVEVA